MKQALAALLLGFALLALAYHHPPLVDWPEHLAQDAIVGRLHDPLTRYAEYYRTTGWFIPYQGFRWVHIALARLLGYDLGARVALLGYLVGTPLAAWGLARRAGRDPWLAIAALTLLVDANFLWGFAPHALGTTLLLAGLCVLLDFLRAPGLPRGVVLALVSVALFFTHAHQTAVFLASAGALVAVARFRGEISTRRGITALGLLLPAAVLLAAFMLGAGWLSGAAMNNDGFSSALGPAHWNTPWDTVRLWPWNAGLSLAGRLPIAAFVLALAGVALGARSTNGEEKSSETAWGFVGPTLAVVWLALFFALPGEFRGQTIAPRVASLALLGVLFALPWRAGGTRSLPRALVLAAAALALVNAHVKFARFERAMAGLDGALERIPRGSRVAALAYGIYEPGLALPVYLHLGGYAVAERGGMASSGFVRTGVTYRESVPRGVLTVRELWRPSAEGWQLDRERAAYYDYVLVHAGAGYPGTPFAPGVQGGTRLLARDGLEVWSTRPESARRDRPGDG